MSLLEVNNLSKTFVMRGSKGKRKVAAVQDVSFSLDRGEVLGVVGESGSGKSTTVRLLLGLITPDEGTVTLDGVDVLGARGKELRLLRRRMPMVFQDPYSSLDPSWLIGDIISEPMMLNGVTSASVRRARVAELLEQVSLPTSFASRYTYELSGGQRQRIAIARALACDPELIICDEALSALDVSNQASMLRLLLRLKREQGVAILFIGHDLAMVRSISDKVAVMYQGRVLEYGETESVYNSPQSPYTRALIDAAPIPDPKVQRARKRAPLPSVDELLEQQ